MAARRSTPAFSTSSTSTTGAAASTAVSAIMRARDWPPLRAQSGVSSSKGSPHSRQAASMTRHVRVSSAILRALACNARNCPTGRSSTNCMDCESSATRWWESSVRSLAVPPPESSTRRPLGESPSESHSMSASKRLLPDPVGPTSANRSPGLSSRHSKDSGTPSRSRPGKMRSSSSSAITAAPSA